MIEQEGRQSLFLENLPKKKETGASTAACLKPMTAR